MPRAANQNLGHGSRAQNPAEEWLCAPTKAKHSAQIPENTPFPYTLTIRATTTERTLSAIPVAIRSNGIDGAFNDPETLEAVELMWDIGAHSTIIVEDMLSAELRQYLHSRYTIHTDARRG